ncbi:MAG: hypothetical protein AAB448_02520 [Patescibacteria group bacterium]
MKKVLYPETATLRYLWPKIEIQNARRSADCDLEVKIIFIRPDAIGIHEDHDPQKLREVFVSILRSGYRGPAISVMELTSEWAFEKIRDRDTVTDPSLNFGVIDGHNRLVVFKLLKLIGILKHDLIPVQLVPIHSNVIFTATSDPTKAPVPIETVKEINSTPGQTLSNQSPSHFRVRFKDGSDSRIREGQPDIIIDLNELLNLAEFDERILYDNAEKISQYIPIKKLKKMLAGA